MTYYIPAQWHQWLRYVRHDPPSIEEQQRDVVRQIQMKKLAQLADERWASKPSYLDKPQTQQPTPATRTSGPTVHPSESSGPPPDQPGVENAVESQVEGTKKDKTEKNPWARAPSGPGETWQPASWTPSAARR
jgi:NADH dehydrogenase [ubiquinone] 1 alpha subcomplex assembly factor 2